MLQDSVAKQLNSQLVSLGPILLQVLAVWSKAPCLREHILHIKGSHAGEGIYFLVVQNGRMAIVIPGRIWFCHAG
jgi:hypothetical protein